MTEKVAQMFQDMEASQKHNVIFKSIAFPDTKNMKEKRAEAIVKTTYTCDDNACDFTQAILDIQSNPRLLKSRTTDFCKEIVFDINKHQEDYLPGEVDGYCINRMGHELVHLQREGCDGQVVFGLIEYNNLRKESMDYFDKQKIEAINARFNSRAKKALETSSCATM